MSRAGTADAVLDAYRPASFAERCAIKYALARLDEGADPVAVLAELEAARDEIEDWVELEENHGIAEVLKLLGQWLMAGWEGGERVPAAAWIQGSGGVSDVGPALRDQRRRADPVFNLWRGMPL